MTQEDIRRVQGSFAALQGRTEALGQAFYARLFETHPGLREMFPEDMAEQPRKLVRMLALVVSHLYAFDAIRPAVEAMARRHVGYGVKDAHYAVVGETLLWALAQTGGPDFSDEDRAAWAAAFATLSGVMIAAGAEAAAREGREPVWL